MWQLENEIIDGVVYIFVILKENISIVLKQKREQFFAPFL